MPVSDLAHYFVWLIILFSSLSFAEPQKHEHIPDRIPEEGKNFYVYYLAFDSAWADPVTSGHLRQITVKNKRLKCSGILLKKGPLISHPHDKKYKKRVAL